MLIVAVVVPEEMKKAWVFSVYPEGEIGKVCSARRVYEPPSPRCSVFLELYLFDFVDLLVDGLSAGNKFRVVLKLVAVVISARAFTGVLLREHSIAPQVRDYLHTGETGPQAIDQPEDCCFCILENSVFVIQVNPVFVFIIVRLIVGDVEAGVNEPCVAPLVDFGRAVLAALASDDLKVDGLAIVNVEGCSDRKSVV